MGHIEIRESRPEDATGIEVLYPQAFPEEDLVPLVKELLDFGPSVLSLVATFDNEIVGHVGFTECQVESSTKPVSLLGPLAVTPKLHKQGIGSALVRNGFEHIKESDAQWIYVLGDPAYYSRFGFRAEDNVLPPYPLPSEWAGAWQSVDVSGSSERLVGQLIVPEPWRHVSLWSN